VTPLEKAAIDAARAMVKEVKEDNSTNELFTRFLGYRDLRAAIAALDAAPTQRRGAGCPRPHHLLIRGEVCPDCRFAPVEEERCPTCAGTGAPWGDEGGTDCLACGGTGKAKGVDADGAACWCCIPSMIPYRGHDTGCETARAALGVERGTDHG
jgi:hypothetical protein